MSSEKQVIENLKVGNEMLAVQGLDGNWDSDPYMYGLYNGMEFMLSLIEGREPIFRGAPKKWKSPTKLQKLLWRIRRFFNPRYGVSSSNEQ